MPRWTMADVVAAKNRMESNRPLTGDELLWMGTDLVPTERVTKEQMRKEYPKPSKYGNKKTGKYASKREAKRAEELRAMQAAEHIVGLKEQVPFELIPKQDGERACKYIADFVYYDMEPLKAAVLVVEDAKGYRDPVYRIKRKLMLKIHGIRIREV